MVTINCGGSLMEDKEFEAIKSIAKKRNKKVDAAGETDGSKNYMTTYYAVLLKQKIEALHKMVEWRQENIKGLSSKRRRQKENDALTL